MFLNLRAIRRPKVMLECIDIHNLSLQEISLSLVLLIENPNLFRIRISRLDYQIFLEDYRLAEGSTYHPGGDFQINRLHSSVIEIPISFPFSKSGLGIRTALIPGKVPYRIEAVFFLDFSLGTIPVRISHQGTHQVNFPEIPKDHSFPADDLTDSEIRPSPSIH